MHGLHLTADLHGCDAAPGLLGDVQALRVLALEAVRAVGLHCVGELFHRFDSPGGVTGVVLLAESHLALHTWPELAAVTLDVYVCNRGTDHGAAAEHLMAALEAVFAPAHRERGRVVRGDLALGAPASRAAITHSVRAPRAQRRSHSQSPAASQPAVNASSNTE